MPIASTRSHRDEREALLPPALVPLFDDRFIASCDLLDEYVASHYEIVDSSGVYRMILRKP